MQQITFEGATYMNRSKKTRKQKFLEKTDKAVQWQKMVAVIKLHYPKGERGRRPSVRAAGINQHLYDPQAVSGLLTGIRMSDKHEENLSESQNGQTKCHHW
jgi:IS5 family transposase